MMIIHVTAYVRNVHYSCISFYAIWFIFLKINGDLPVAIVHGIKILIRHVTKYN